MIDELLKSCIAGRDVQSMKMSEAKLIVNEFFSKLNRITFGQRNQAKIDYLANKALRRNGLECFCYIKIS